MPSLDALNPAIRDHAKYLVDVLAYNGRRVQITSVVRTRAQQANLYARYLAGRSQYPVAPPGRSDHEYGLAWDMVVNGDSRGPLQAQAGALWRSWGGRWSESDPVHFFYR